MVCMKAFSAYTCAASNETLLLLNTSCQLPVEYDTTILPRI